jgi:RNA polymerase sigma-70 factor (ECF subfamily)
LNDENAGEAHSVADAGLAPDAAFDRQWALTVMARAFEALRLECAGEGREAFFHQVKPWLTGEAARGDQAAVAADCGMNPAALKVAVHRMKKRFRQAVKAEVAGTLDDPGQVEAEMNALLAALGN